MSAQDVKKRLAIAPPKALDVDDDLEAMRTAGPRIDTSKFRAKTKKVHMYVCSCGEVRATPVCDLVSEHDVEVPV